MIDRYDIWCVEQLGRAMKKKVQNNIFVRPALHQANTFQIFFTTFVIKRTFGKVFTSHVQLVLKNGHILPTGQWYALSEVINDAMIMPEYARVGKSMPKYARVFQSMQEYARV